jgi:hypothetical protein
MPHLCNQIDDAVQSFADIKVYERVAKAIEFKEAYKRRTGHRPSLVSVIALYQKAENDKVELAAMVSEFQSKLDDERAKVEALEQALSAKEGEAE